MAKKKELLETTFVNNEGCKLKIVDYVNNRQVGIIFEGSEQIYWAELTAIKNGRVKNPLFPSVFGVGFIGEGKYKVSESGKLTKAYSFWSGMFERCYRPGFWESHPTYMGCTVCDEWHNYQNFAKWFEDNYYEVEGEDMHLDKDILVKNNKIYSPDTCVFVPKSINLFPNKRQNFRGDLPMGVTYKSDNPKKYVSRVNNPLTKEREYLGVYSNIEEAFEVYKERKESIAKDLANFYKEFIPQKLYISLMSYKVEYND